ncbi:hypothetical protein [Cyclobacterium marinum]|uniref:hypothetical protein n=1 Tax=Cyclobacterium marinum TaxID=104 RepID=UPI001658ECF9|nr:hypothetical protein [Cyclobacterium marinum]MBI0397963.1 hypothetical protein [Cyclobacterium marinum]
MGEAYQIRDQKIEHDEIVMPMIIVARFHPDKPGQVLAFEKQIETDEMPYFLTFELYS